MKKDIIIILFYIVAFVGTISIILNFVSINTIHTKGDELKASNSGISDTFGQLEGAILPVTAGIAAMAGVFKLTKEIIESTGESGEKFEVVIGGMQAGWESFKRSIATGDFKDLRDNMESANNKLKYMLVWLRNIN